MSHAPYTDSFGTDSSLVDGVYYNENDQSLIVDLNDEIYRYSNVPKSVFGDFQNASSAGRFYSSEVKRQYGPAEHLGDYDNVVFDRVGKQGAVGTPKNLTYASNAIVTGAGEFMTNYLPTVSTATEGSATGRVFDLKVPTAPSGLRQHAVVFEVDGKTKVHNLKAESVDEAMEAVQQIGDMLDLTFTVKQVVTTIE